LRAVDARRRQGQDCIACSPAWGALLLRLVPRAAGAGSRGPSSAVGSPRIEYATFPVHMHRVRVGGWRSMRRSSWSPPLLKLPALPRLLEGPARAQQHALRCDSGEDATAEGERAAPARAQRRTRGKREKEVETAGREGGREGGRDGRLMRSRLRSTTAWRRRRNASREASR